MKNKLFKYWFSLILLSIIGSLIFISFFGSMSFSFQALEFRISLQIFDHGFTDFKIPPIGSIRAKTHIAPLKVAISLQNIDLKLLQSFLEESPDKEKLIKDFEKKIFNITKVFLVRLLFITTLGGLAGSLIYQRKKLKPLLIGGLVGVLIYTILILGTLSTYDPTAFQNPEYHGMLEAAPWMIGLAEQAFIKLDTLGEQLELMAANLYLLFEKINTLEALSSWEGNVKVLHVSDFHNNKAALQYVMQVTKSFNVDFVIDTGDFTDYATPIEAQLLENLKEINVPYIFVPGNHDSPTIINKIEKFPNVHIINEEIIEVKGLRILGIEDPASIHNGVVPPNEEIINQYQDRLLKIWEETDEDNRPHIVAVHNYNVGQVLKNKAPLILHGHNHSYKIYKDGTTLVVNAGTTGGAGIRGLQATKEIPYTVVLLHFQQENNNYRLTAVDTIIVYNLEGGFILERQVIENEDLIN